MKASSKRRAPDPISIADILRSPVLQRPGVAIPTDDRARHIVAELALCPVPDLVDGRAPFFSAPNFGASEHGQLADTKVDASKFDALEKGAAPPLDLQHENVGALDTNASQSSAPNFGALEPEPFDLHDLVYTRSSNRNYPIQPAARIQDSLTGQEYRVLEFLWHRGREVPGVSMLRIAGGGSKNGARILAAQLGIAYSTFQALTKSIRDKFALEIVQPGNALCKVYAVYHFSAILEAQKKSGFAFFIRQNGGGRLLVNGAGERCPHRSDLTVDQLQAKLDALKFGAPKSMADAPNFGAVSANSGAPNFGAALRNNKYPTINESTSTTIAAAPKAVIDALFDRTGRTDADAARTLVRRCQESNPLIQTEEIARLVRAFFIPENSTNPVGLIISTVPNQCTSESLGNYRALWEQEAQAEEQKRRTQANQEIEAARSILENPEAWDPDSLAWARQTAEAADTKFSMLAEAKGQGRD